MSKNIKGVPVLFKEPPQSCEICGAFEECRPYGPGGKQICFNCGQKDPKATRREMDKRLFKAPGIQ